MKPESEHYLLGIVRQQKRGIPAGICSVCSAHPWVIDAVLTSARDNPPPALIEATCNQVNQVGGYTGMTPADFARFARSRAEALGVPEERLILGGDHLGPHPWRRLGASAAMDRACAMTRDFARAGFTKIHLDASMHLADDPGDRHQPLDNQRVAQRAAMLCEAAEAGYAARRAESPAAVAPVYVIGTEVPVPGGVEGAEGPPETTRVEDFEECVATTRAAFAERGLEGAWERVIAVVVQPGVEFGDQIVHRYNPEKAAALSRALAGHLNLVFEGHSTDYQDGEVLRRMVSDGVAILKVGPALTFAMREALFALEAIEREMPAGSAAEFSRLGEVMEEIMLAHPEHWRPYYHGSEADLRLARRYSLSDRIRYYWTAPQAQIAVKRLIDNLRHVPIPLSLLSQFLPVQHGKVRRGQLENDPEALILDCIQEALNPYYRATEKGGAGTFFREKQ